MSARPRRRGIESCTGNVKSQRERWREKRTWEWREDDRGKNGESGVEGRELSVGSRREKK